MPRQNQKGLRGSSAAGQRGRSHADSNARGSATPQGLAWNAASMGIRSGLGLGPPSSEERDSRQVGAPGGGIPPHDRPTPEGASLGRRASGRGVAASVTWLPGCGRRPRTGDVVLPRASASTPVLLTAKDTVRALRVGPRLSASEAREIAKQAAHGKSAGARVLRHRAGRVDLSLPSHVPAYRADATRAVMRLTRRMIGRAVGIRGCLEGLREIGWCA